MYAIVRKRGPGSWMTRGPSSRFLGEEKGDSAASDRAERGRFAAQVRDRFQFPFLLRADDHRAGFALVHHKSKLSGADDVWDMAEFFVLRRYRRRGVGTEAAHRIFATHAGSWEVRQRHVNAAATSFWRRVIDAYTGGFFAEELLDDERWHGPVQRFTGGATRGP